MPLAYYNENDPHAAAALRARIAAGLIAPGHVDERSILDVVPTDLMGYSQVHLFAGEGGWSVALRLAGLPDDYPIWTGSCPCQPFSQAGKGKGALDQRHLWPAMLWLLRQCRPRLVLGEQVARAIGFHWLSGIQTDVEAEGYLLGPAVLGAHSVGAPQIRQRLYWGAVRVADGDDAGCRELRASLPVPAQDPPPELRCDIGHWSHAVWWPCRDGKLRRVPARRMGYASGDHELRYPLSGPYGEWLSPGGPGGNGGVDIPHGGGQPPLPQPDRDPAQAPPDRHPSRHDAGRTLGDGRLPHPQRLEHQGCVPRRGEGDRQAREWSPEQPAGHRVPLPVARHDWLEIEPGLFPLAPRISGRVAVLRPPGCPATPDTPEVRHVNAAAALRAAGNSIVPQLAAVFAQEFLSLPQLSALIPHPFPGALP